MSRNAKSGIVSEHAIQSLRCLLRTIRNRHLSRVQRVANANSAAMMKRNPTRATRSVQQSIQDGPVSDCIRSVFHSFGFAKRRSNGTGVEMIAPNCDWRLQVASFD